MQANSYSTISFTLNKGSHLSKILLFGEVYYRKCWKKKEVRGFNCNDGSLNKVFLIKSNVLLCKKT